MSQFSYGIVQLEMPRTMNWIENQEADVHRRLYSLVDLTVRGVYNPKATSYRAAPGRPEGLEFRAGLNAPVTAQAIHDYLMGERRKLVYVQGGITIFDLPAQGYITDAANGPMPQSVRVTENHAEKTFLVDFTVRLAVNKCRPSSGLLPQVVLSSIWGSHETTDEDFLTVRVLSGRLVIRSDEAYRRDFFPDAFRPALFPASIIPPNFQREQIDVVAEEDGNTLTWRCVDREKCFNIGPRLVALGVTRIKATHLVNVGRPPPDDVTLGILRSFVVAAPGIMLGGPVGAVTSLFHTALDAAFKGLEWIPHVRHTVTVGVYGHRRSRKRDLERVAHGIIEARLNHLNEAGNGVNMSVYRDEQGKFVEVTLVWEASLATAARQTFGLSIPVIVAGVATGGPPEMVVSALRLMPDFEDCNAVLPPLGAAGPPRPEPFYTQAPNDTWNNPIPPGAGSEGTRGTYLGQCVAQVLASACALPQPVPDPEDITPADNELAFR